MTIDAVLSSLRRARETARAHGMFEAAEDYDDAMLLLISRAHAAAAEGRAGFLAARAPHDAGAGRLC
jgi:hypothetical protein